MNKKKYRINVGIMMRGGKNFLRLHVWEEDNETCYRHVVRKAHERRLI